jgi:hypothetical protein
VALGAGKTDQRTRNETFFRGQNLKIHENQAGNQGTPYIPRETFKERPLMIRIQNVATALVLSFAATSMAQNLITNPGFETSGSGWTLWKDASASAAVAAVTYPTTGSRSGTRHAQIVVATPATENWHIQFQPPADWEAGINASYEMKFWAKSSGSNSMHFSVQDGPNNSFMYRSGFDFPFTPDWTEYSFQYTSDVEGAGALRFFLYVGANADTLRFDDFSLTQTAASINHGAKAEARQALRVRQGAGSLAVSLDGGVSENWKAELVNLRGVSLASAKGRADGALNLALPKETGTYFVIAKTSTRTFVHRMMVR